MEEISAFISTSLSKSSPEAAREIAQTCEGSARLYQRISDDLESRSPSREASEQSGKAAEGNSGKEVSGGRGELDGLLRWVKNGKGALDTERREKQYMSIHPAPDGCCG
jgi:hypothetical protein